MRTGLEKRGRPEARAINYQVDEWAVIVEPKQVPDFA